MYCINGEVVPHILIAYTLKAYLLVKNLCRSSLFALTFAKNNNQKK